MKHKNKVIALLLPFVGMMAAVAIILDGTLAAAAQTTPPAPALLVKHTAVSPQPVAAANHAAALTALMTEQTSTAAACTTPTKILPVGDSITYGKNSSSNAGYRLPLFLQLRDSGYDVEFVGSQADGPTIGFDPDHDGYSSKKIQFFEPRIVNYINNSNANIVLLHVGTNDIGSITDTAELEQLLDNVVANNTATGKNVQVVLAQIINRACPTALQTCQERIAQTTEFNGWLVDVANNYSIVTLVDMENDPGFTYTQGPGGDFSDDLHPNDYGYGLMAPVWQDALETLLPGQCNTPPLILGNAPTETAVLARYTAQITASGAGAKSFSLNNHPVGMTIDANGLIYWIPTVAQVGSHAVELLVTSPFGSDTYNFNINVTNPGVAVLQEPYISAVLKNGSLQFTVDISNTGSLTLTSIPVSFPFSSACNTNAGALDPGASTQIVCNAASTAADFTHPVYVSATNSNLAVVYANDSATIDVIDPNLSVVKTAVASPILYNTTANFTVTVTNTGDVNLTNVEVVDPDTPDCSNSGIGTLTPGQGITYSCSFANATSDINATATATGTHILGQVNGNDNAIVDVINPSVALSITPDEQQILSGNNVNFWVTVTNTGDVILSNVVVTDTVVPSCAKDNFSPISPGAKVNYACSSNNVTGDFYNNASVTADHVIGQVTDNSSALVDVFSADVDVSISANAYALLGTNVTFNVQVTNTSGTTMNNVRINDTSTGCNFVITSLADGALHNESCIATNVQTDLANTAYVTGTLPVVGDVSSSDIALVDVIDPSINISITPGTQEVDVGDPATFTVTVENTGDVNLTGVNVSSTAVPACNKSIGTITAGTDTTFTYTCTIPSASVELNNKVTGTGNHPLGSVSDNDTAVLELSTFYIYVPFLIKP